MSVASIKALIAAEGSACNIVGHVAGIPRTYGNRKSEDIWRKCICEGNWKGIEAASVPIDSPVFMTFLFRVNPKSSAYYPNVSPNGPDIDTMVIGALAGITLAKDRPSLGLLSRAANCWGYAATKEIVDQDNETGVDITLSMRSSPNLEGFRAMLPERGLSITILCGTKRQEMAKLAVESANIDQRFFPACTPISMAIVFNSFGRARNVTAIDQIEALIDGMGAAIVGERRFFDAPRGKYIKERYGFDDSCIFSLLVGRVHFEDDQIDAVVDISSECTA